MTFVPRENYTITDLVEIVKILRSPDGCPWDQEQTHHSIRSNLIEETYEVVQAIDEQDATMLEEELGDLLLQIVLHAQMENEQQTFDFDDVCDGICKKLIYRHPHVFGETVASDKKKNLSPDDVLNKWDELKNKEKGRETVSDRLNSVPTVLPALMRTEKIQNRAGKFGFDYDAISRALADLQSEVQELQQAIDTGDGIEDEVGDVLFSATNVARMAHINAEEALTKSSNKFTDRVVTIDTLARQDGKTLNALSPEELDTYWNLAKQQE